MEMQVRQYEAAREHKTLVFTIVSSLNDALRAANEWKVDALVVQGHTYHIIRVSSKEVRSDATFGCDRQ